MSDSDQYCVVGNQPELLCKCCREQPVEGQLLNVPSHGSAGPSPMPHLPRAAGSAASTFPLLAWGINTPRDAETCHSSSNLYISIFTPGRGFTSPSTRVSEEHHQDLKQGVVAEG